MTASWRLVKSGLIHKINSAEEIVLEMMTDLERKEILNWIFNFYNNG
jgi:hypothetical protein